MPPVDLPRSPAVAALEGEDDVYVVGGAVRDLLLGREPHELDFVVEGDALEVARRASAVVSISHERFGTATVSLDGVTFDLAGARRERYERPGALPEVELGATLREDLERRDFTVNAIAAAPQGRRADLAAGRARGPRRAAPAGAARPLVPRRPDAAAAPGPVRRPARVRTGGAHRPVGRRGGRRRGASTPSPARGWAPSCGCCCGSRSRRRCSRSSATGSGAALLGDGVRGPTSARWR